VKVSKKSREERREGRTTNGNDLSGLEDSDISNEDVLEVRRGISKISDVFFCMGRKGGNARKH